MEKLAVIDDPVGLIFELEPNPRHPSWYSIAQAILCYGHCYSVLITVDEFRRLLLNSDADAAQRQLSLEEYPTLEEVVRHIQQRPAFYQEQRTDRGISGSQVKRYITDLEQQGSKPKGCLITDKPDGMQLEGSYYIRDGMHRLVAYGIWTNFSAEGFPIQVFYCTNIAL